MSSSRRTASATPTRLPRRGAWAVGAAAAAAALAFAAVCFAARPANDHEGPAQRASSVTDTDSTTYSQISAGRRPNDNKKISDVVVNMTNYGFIGTNYSGRGPSFEYPYYDGIGAHVDHLVRGGLWIGAFNTDTGLNRVTTGTVDGTYNTRTNTASEFTPREWRGRDALGAVSYYPFRVLSNLLLDPNFDSTAISNQDIIAQYVDSPGRSLTGDEGHKPLVNGGVHVKQRSLAWGFDPSNKFVLCEYTITNPFESGEFLDSVYVGIYSEMASVDKNQFAQFPPSGSSLFAMKDIAYIDSLRLLEEHHFQSAGYEETKDGPYSWAGMKFLGHSKADTLAGLPTYTTFHWFTYDPSDTTRNSDAKRYRIMADPVPTNADGVEALEQCERTTRDPTTCDPVCVLAHGPFRLAPGESLVVAYGYIGGENEDDLQANARTAQRAYDLGYRVPQPPPSPGLVVTPTLGSVTLRWERSPESFVDRSRNENKMDFEGYRVYVSEDGFNFKLVREIDRVDSLNFNTGLDVLRDPHPVVYRTVEVVDPETGQTTTRVDSTYYTFTIDGLKSGFRYWVSVTAFDIGDPINNVGPLESGISQNVTVAIPGPPAGGDNGDVVVFPNPYKGTALWDGQFARDKLIWFANLPKRCDIKIYTLSGDLVQTIPFDAATYHGENSRLLSGGSALSAPPVLSGTMAGWNMISSAEQEVGSGLYLYSVIDKETQKVSTGHFLIIK